ncbi:hypothetical protein ACFORG_08875 [Lutimaribacter marinistellae]|uniref:Sulfotransferase family protein n=1 Tax=Lutimaribacter marinistellae TaxID=1820329 RepID=A0ABV7TE77_9RHOB
MREVPGDKDALVSFEGFFVQLVKNPKGKTAEWAEIARAHGFTEIKVLLFVRNPIGHMVSIYNQSLQYNGVSVSLDEFAMNYRYPEMAWFVIEALNRHPDYSLCLLNYDVAKADLVGHTCQWLGADKESFPEIDAKRIVNRGLSRGEIEVIRFLNGVTPLSGRFASKCLLEVFTKGKTAKPKPCADVQQMVAVNNGDAMAMISRFASPGHAYKIDYIDEVRPDTSKREVMVAALKTAIAVLIYGGPLLVMRVKKDYLARRPAKTAPAGR